MADSIQGKEITDNDLAELRAAEVTPTTEEVGSDDPTQLAVDSEDLPEGIQDEEAPNKDAEPSQESEISYLKRIGVWRPGLIETIDDLAKSYLHADKFISSTKRVPAESISPPKPTANPEKIVSDLKEKFEENPVGAMAEVYTILNLENNAKLDRIEQSTFASQNEGFNKYSDRVVEIKGLYSGMTTEAAYNMARGEDIDSVESDVVADTTAAVLKRESAKKSARRERPGGPRSQPATIESEMQLLQAREDTMTGHEYRTEMEALYKKHKLA